MTAFSQQGTGVAVAIQSLRTDPAARAAGPATSRAEPIEASTENGKSEFESLVETEALQPAAKPDSDRRCTPETTNANPAATLVETESADRWGVRLLETLRAEPAAQRHVTVDPEVAVDQDDTVVVASTESLPCFALLTLALPPAEPKSPAAPSIECAVPASNTAAPTPTATALHRSDAASLTNSLAGSDVQSQASAVSAALPDVLSTLAKKARRGMADSLPSAGSLAERVAVDGQALSLSMPTQLTTLPSTVTAPVGDTAGAVAAAVSTSTAAPAVLAPSPSAILAHSTAAPVPLAELPLRLSDQLQWLLKNELQEVRLKLHPRELGHVGVQIRVEGQVVQVSFTAEHPAARAALEQALPMLRERFATDGLQLQQASVGGGNSQGNAGGNGNAQTSARSADSFWQQDAESTSETPEPSLKDEAVRVRRGLVDHYA